MIQNSYLDKNGKTYHLKYYECDDFSSLDKTKVRQVYGVCYHNNKIVICFDGYNYTLPGGKPEQGESYLRTLNREIREESNMKLLKAVPIGYVYVVEEDIYALRYACLVEAYGNFIKDPDETIKSIRLVKPSEFTDYIKWGKIAQELLKKSKVALNLTN
jgi:ADP-ribose pyrophosphatase YjhB (NUDIX family)